MKNLISPKNGISKQNLRTRIRTHFAGNAEGSTLRLTLRILLTNESNVPLVGRCAYRPGDKTVNEGGTAIQESQEGRKECNYISAYSLKILGLALLHHVPSHPLRALGLGDVTKAAFHRAGYFPCRRLVSHAPNKLPKVLYEGLVDSSAWNVDFVVGVDEFPVEGHALVLAQDPRYGVHVGHDLDMVGGAGFPCLGVVNCTVLPRYGD
jgi:hypothetical protein